MKTPRTYIAAEKQQELLLKALSGYVHKMTGSDPEHTGRHIKMTMQEVMASRNISFSDSKKLPNNEREGLVELAIIIFLRKTRVSCDFHESIRHGSIQIFRKWANSLRVPHDQVDNELHALIDDLMKKGIMQQNSMFDLYRRPKQC